LQRLTSNSSISSVLRGEKKIEVARFFNISRNTLDLWLKKEKETGNFFACQPKQKGRKPKIQDLEKFKEFVKSNSDKTQKQMAELLGNGITQQNISDACKKAKINSFPGKIIFTIDRNLANNRLAKKLGTIELSSDFEESCFS